MPSPAVVAIVLAAGEGRRFGGPGHKLDAEIDGRSLLRRALDAAVASRDRPGAARRRRRRPTARSARASPMTWSRSSTARWRDGSATSLQAGLARAAELGADRAVIALGDQPFITAEAWRAVAAADAAIAVATYDGVRGHPVQLRQPTSGRCCRREGDEGAKAVMRLRPDLVREIPCRGSAADIDTVEDLHRWQNSSSTSSP